MTRYIALLRGLNISGKNKISMPNLKKLNSAGMWLSGLLIESFTQKLTGGKRQLLLALEK